MCARYTLRANAGKLMELFWLAELPDMEAQYNIPPTTQILTITGEEGHGAASFRRWGLVPHFSKEPGAGPLMLNARSETAFEKPSFRGLLNKKRCLIPADGFFEWAQEGGKKQPYLFEVDEGAVFAFAGLYDHWEGAAEAPIDSCTILTCEPNSLIQNIHDRMPVLIEQEHFGDWLNLELPAKAFFTAFDPQRMSMRAVNPDMGSPKVQGPAAIESAGLF